MAALLNHLASFLNTQKPNPLSTQPGYNGGKRPFAPTPVPDVTPGKKKSGLPTPVPNVPMYARKTLLGN